MEKCPKCGKYTVAYDSYRQKFMCECDGCTYSREKDTLESRIEKLEEKVTLLMRNPFVDFGHSR